MALFCLCITYNKSAEIKARRWFAGLCVAIRFVLVLLGGASDETCRCGRSLHYSAHQPNRHSVSAILWATRWLLLLWLASRVVLRPGAGRSRLGSHTHSA